jgi:hypothetical protein
VSEAENGFDPSQIRQDLFSVAHQNVKLGIARDNNAHWLGGSKASPSLLLKLDRSRQKKRHEAAGGANAKNRFVCLI